MKWKRILWGSMSYEDVIAEIPKNIKDKLENEVDEE